MTCYFFSYPITFLMLAIGMVALFFGGKFVVDNAVIIAHDFLHVSEKFIGLTILALGTSLPELVTSVIAIKKGRNDLAIGNVVGSNIFNILLVLGVSSLITPISYNFALNIDFIFLIGATLLLLISVIFIGKKGEITRGESIFFIVIYLVYLLFLFYRR